MPRFSLTLSVTVAPGSTQAVPISISIVLDPFKVITGDSVSGVSASAAGSGSGSDTGAGAETAWLLANSNNFRISSLVRHWSSTQIFSLARKVLANRSPIPFAASASQVFILSKIFWKNSSAKDRAEGVVEAVEEAIASNRRLSSWVALVRIADIFS